MKIILILEVTVKYIIKRKQIVSIGNREVARLPALQEVLSQGPYQFMNKRSLLMISDSHANLIARFGD